MRVVRYELRSAAELDRLARAALPLGIYAGEPRPSAHRDLYLDTPDDALRSRGMICRLRIGERPPQRLTLVLGNEDTAERIEVTVRASNAREALDADSSVRSRLLSIVDPSALVVRVELEVDRLTRAVNPDLLLRRRAEMHFDRITVRRDRETRTLFQLCAHHRRGSASEFRRLVEGLEREHHLVGAEGDRRGLAELLLRWMRPAAESGMHASSDHEAPYVTETHAVPEMLSPELSLLAFQRRVLAIAEDPATPLRERLRFLGIVTSNLDEIFMVTRAASMVSRRATGSIAWSARSRRSSTRSPAARSSASRRRSRSACACCAGASSPPSSRPVSAPDVATRSIPSSRRSR
jgi:hypothetical protein